MTKVIRNQGLLGFGKTELPRTTRVLDRCQWACRRTAIVTRDGNEVGISFGNTGSNRANTWLGNQFYRYQCIWVNLLQIEDKLS